MCVLRAGSKTKLFFLPDTTQRKYFTGKSRNYYGSNSKYVLSPHVILLKLEMATTFPAKNRERGATL